MNCSTLEEQLKDQLYILDSSGRFKVASCGDILNHVKECGFCGCVHGSNKQAYEDKYYYFWTLIYIAIVCLIVWAAGK